MRISISLPDELVKEGKEFAYKNGQTFSGLIRKKLVEELNKK